MQIPHATRKQPIPSGKISKRHSTCGAKKQINFYSHRSRRSATGDARNVLRQALAGCFGRSSAITTMSEPGWREIPAAASSARTAKKGATTIGPHLYNADVLSLPDKWEYPWYAAWDLAFHTIALALVDPDLPRNNSSSCCASGTCTRTGNARLRVGVR